MDSFEVNKILGAVLGTCLVLLALNITAGAIFSPEKPKKPGYDIAIQEQPAGAGGGRADREAPRQRRPQARRDRGQEMRRLPYLREGRAQSRRSKSVGDYW